MANKQESEKYEYAIIDGEIVKGKLMTRENPLWGPVFKFIKVKKLDVYKGEIYFDTLQDAKDYLIYKRFSETERKIEENKKSWFGRFF